MPCSSRVSPSPESALGGSESPLTTLSIDVAASIARYLSIKDVVQFSACCSTTADTCRRPDIWLPFAERHCPSDASVRWGSEVPGSDGVANNDPQLGGEAALDAVKRSFLALHGGKEQAALWALRERVARRASRALGGRSELIPSIFLWLITLQMARWRSRAHLLSLVLEFPVGLGAPVSRPPADPLFTKLHQLRTYLLIPPLPAGHCGVRVLAHADA